MRSGRAIDPPGGGGVRGRRCPWGLLGLLGALCLGGCAGTPDADDMGPNAPSEAKTGTPATRLVIAIEGTHYVGSGRLSKAAVDELDDAREMLREARSSELWFRPKSAIDDAAWTMEELYRAEGFPFAQVEYDFRVRFAVDGEDVEFDEPPETFAGARPTGVELVTFRVYEGPQPQIDEITFRGREAFDSELLEEFFTGPRGGLFGGGSTNYVEADVESAVASIAAYYVSKGYLEAEARLDEVRFTEDRSACQLAISIREGQLVRVREVRFTGDALPESVELRATASALSGQPYYPRLPFETRGRLLGLLGNLGYPRVEIEVVETRAEPRVDENSIPVELAFDVDLGPLVVVSGVEYVGNERTRASTLERKLAFEVGEPYTLDAERQSFERLYRSGLFERVRIRPEPRDLGSADERWVVVVDVIENDHREYFLEPGYGSYERARVSAGFRHKNAFGTGMAFRLEGIYGDRAQSAETGLTRDRFLGSPLDADLALIYGRREEPSFTSQTVGSNFTLTHDFNRRLRASLRYGISHSEITEIEVLDSAVLEALANVNIASVTTALNYDSTNNNFVPSAGGVHVGSLERAAGALGSEVDFVRARTTHSRYVSVAEGTVVGLSWRSGVIVPVSGTEAIPLQERFFNGGENSVRSFQRNVLGPVDSGGNALGGEAFQVFNAELRQVLIENFQGALFVDAGNLREQAEDYGLGDMRYGVGAGLRYLLPIGPVRLDLSFNPDTRDNESEWVLHFSVGNAF